MCREGVALIRIHAAEPAVGGWPSSFEVVRLVTANRLASPTKRHRQFRYLRRYPTLHRGVANVTLHVEKQMLNLLADRRDAPPPARLCCLASTTSHRLSRQRHRPVDGPASVLWCTDRGGVRHGCRADAHSGSRGGGRRLYHRSQPPIGMAHILGTPGVATPNANIPEGRRKP